MSVGPVVKRLRSEWHRPHRWAEMGQARLGKWSALPEGLVVADKPEKLDDALVGLLLFMRWPTPHGWQVGKITSKITPATPRLFKSFNYRCSWSDGWSNQMLRLDEYGGGDEAEYNSWVILEKAAAVREEAGSS